MKHRNATAVLQDNKNDIHISTSSSADSLPPEAVAALKSKALISEAGNITTAEGNIITADGNIITTDGHVIRSTESEKEDGHVFQDPFVADYYARVYERSGYENRHRFDPDYTWTPKEEKKLVRRLDARIMVWACVMFIGLQLDRGNVSQANTDNFLDDLGLSTNDFNYGQSAFRIAFLLAELPSQLMSKKIGPDRWIPMQIILWSLVATSQCRLNSRASWYITRVLLGTLEGGFIPDIVLWLSYFYTSKELPIRLSFFWLATSLCDIAAAFLAVGILRLRGVNGWEGWRYLFLIEGLFTLSIGIGSWFLMRPGPTQTKTWFSPKGWFSEHEEKIMVNRVLRDDPSKGDMHNRQAVTPRELWHALKDYNLWPQYLIGLTSFIPAAPPSQYLTLTLRNLGFSTFLSNVLTIPSSVWFMANLLIVTKVSELVNERTLVSLSMELWVLPCLIALRAWPNDINFNKWGKFATLTVLLAYPYPHAILVGWCSKNSNTVRTRTVSAAVYNMMVQAGSIISLNIYRDSDKPMYYRGNTILLVICAFNIVLFLGIKVFYIVRNRRRERTWNAMSKDEQMNYILTTTDRGSARLDFRFAH